MFKCKVEYMVDGRVHQHTDVLCNVYNYKHLKYLVAHGVYGLPDKSIPITVISTPTINTAVSPIIYICRWHIAGLGNKVLLSVLEKSGIAY